ncbi:MAG: PhzF family phenazine biosynthesis protein [Cyanobacteria bacterium P01_F01_bin.53]
MGLTVIQVDAFTNKPFGGNPAAVCITPQPLTDEVMKNIAAEMNLSETAFLSPLANEAAGSYSLRWFTPAVEVELCGHATLASAHVLWSEGHLVADEAARFQTKSGWLGAKQNDGWIEMDFPAQTTKPAHVMPQLIKSLCCGGNVRKVSKTSTNYLVELNSEEVLKKLTPNFDEMKKLPVQGVIVTAAASDDSYDFVSRYFVPSVGINEDPVTGSAHTSLAPYWQAKLGKSEMLAQQVSARGGIIRVSCQLTNSNDTDETAPENRISISGQAVTVLKGELQLG